MSSVRFFIGGLVGVAVEAGGEDQGGDAGPVEDDLVGELVEEFGEVLAAVEGVVDVEVDVEIPVAHVDETAVFSVQGVFSQNNDKIGVGFVDRLQDCADLVDVYGAYNAVSQVSN